MHRDKALRIAGPHHSWLVPLFIVLASFIFRLVYLNQVESMPTFDNPTMDEEYHLELAGEIGSGEGSAKEPYFRAPLYPRFLAALIRLTGDPFYGARFVQILLGSFLPLLIYLLGLRLFDRKVAFWAAAVASFYPTFLYYDASLLIASLMALLSTLLVWHLSRCTGRSLVQFVVAGLLLGLTGLARPNILLFGPVLFVWVWLMIRPTLGLKRAVIAYALIGAATLAVILPVTIRNYRVSDDFVLIAWQGGFNFFLGNNPNSTGWSATVPGIDYSWKGGYRQAIAFAEQEMGRKLKRSEVSDFWYSAAWQEIKQTPSTFIALLAKKARLLINGYEIPNNQNIYLARQFAPLVRPLMFDKIVYFPYGLLAPLALIGFALSLPSWRKYLLIYLFVFSYAASILLFFVCARYRQPLIPFMLIFAVFAVYKTVGFFRQRQIKNIALLVVILGLLCLESNHDMLRLDPKRVAAEDHQLLGNAHLEQGNPAAAFSEFRKSVAADPTFARGYNSLGVIAVRRADLPRAGKHFQKSVRLDPGMAEAYFNLASTYLEQGDITGAVSLLENACRRFPLHDYAHLKLGMTYFEAGRFDDAKRLVEKSLQLNPNNETAIMVYRELLKAQESSR